MLHVADLGKLEVHPFVTWGRSFDKPCRARIINPTAEAVSVRVYKGYVDDNNLLKELTVAPGDAVYDLCLLGDLEPDASTTLYLAALVDTGMDLTDWVVFKTIPARWGQNDPVAFISFVDENGSPLTVKYVYYDMEGGLVSRATAEAASVWVKEGGYLEVYADYGPGRKYYAIVESTKFEPGYSYQLKLLPQGNYYVKVTYEFDLESAADRAVLGRVLPDPIEDLVARLGAKATEFLIDFFVGGALRGARFLSSLLGLELPIVDVSASAEGSKVRVDVVYAQDIHPILAAIAAAGAVSSIITAIVMWYYREKTTYEIIRVVYEYLGQKTRLTNQAIQACEEACQGDPECFKSCVAETSEAIARTSTYDERLVQGTLKAYSDAKDEADKWKLATAVAGGAAGALLLSRLAARGG